jgi:glycerol-3-phosphate cytidylyltransferase-like family protein
LDTRQKIVPDGGLQIIPRNRQITVIVGHFDPLLAAHGRRIREIARTGTLVVAVITDPPQPVLAARARAELVAGLNGVDYVVIPRENDTESVLAALSPAEVVREESADIGRTAELIAHIQRRQALQAK